MKTESTLERSLKQALDGAVDDLDAAALSRLHEARTTAARRAVRESWRSGFTAHHWGLRAGGLAGLLAVAVALSIWLRPLVPDAELNELANAPDILVEMAVAEVDIDLIDEIEFYDWLTLAQANGDST